jgi:hypothetical protein
MMRPMVFNVDRKLPVASDLSAAQGNPGNILSWTDPTTANDPASLGNPSNEIGFKVERAIVDNTGLAGTYSEIGTVLANKTTYTDNTADPATTYSYRIVAYNAAGNTTSNPAMAGPQIPNPQAPSNLVAALQNGKNVYLTWTDNSTNETGFVIERSENNGAFVQLAAPGAQSNTGSMSYTDTSILAGMNYTYRVKAVNYIGASDYSNIASVSIPSVPIPAAPTNLTAALQTGPQISLTWRDNAINETGFIIERSNNGGVYVQIASPGRRNNTGNVSYTDTTVTAGVTYAYRVKAVNSTVSSAYSNVATVVVPAIPSAPSNLSVTAVRANGNNRTVTLRWTDNSNNETGFTIQRATNSTFSSGLSTITVAANTNTLSQTGLQRRTNYYYRIAAVNTGGATTWINATPFPVTTP